MQISRFLGAGRSGFISAETDNGGFRFESIPTPRPSTRGCKEPFGIFEGPADQLITPESGIGLRVTNVDFEEEMEMVFIRDRWPRFKYCSEEWPFSLQYFVRNGIVIQNYVIHRPPEKQQADESEGKKSTQPQWPKLKIHTNLLIRDPGWEEYWHFDEALQKHTIVVFFRTPRSTENRLVGLVIAPFVNGKVASLRKVGKTEMEKKDGREYYILLPEEVEKDPTRLEVTIGYRLQLLKGDGNPWQSSLIQAKEIAAIRQMLSGPRYKELAFSVSPSSSSSPFMDFLIRRNLEHVLSVCCIPVSEEPMWDFDEEGNKIVDPAVMEDERAIAITCGDISGHHMLTSASL